MPQTILPKNVRDLLDQVALEFDGPMTVEAIGAAIAARHERNWQVVNKVVG